MTHRLSFAAALLCALLAGTATFAGGFGPAQGGGGGGGGVSNPATAGLDMGGFSVTNLGGLALGANKAITAAGQLTIELDNGDLNIDAGPTSDTIYLGANNANDVVTGGNFSLASGKTLTGGTLSWASWTPTGSWSTNTTYAGYRARIGNDLLARVKITLSGDPGAGALTINLPSGLTIDTTAHASPAVSAAALGFGQGLDAGTLAYPLTVSYHSSDTLVVVNALTAGGTYAALSNASAVSDVPFDWQSGDSLSVEFRVTCTGW